MSRCPSSSRKRPLDKDESSAEESIQVESQSCQPPAKRQRLNLNRHEVQAVQRLDNALERYFSQFGSDENPVQYLASCISSPPVLKLLQQVSKRGSSSAVNIDPNWTFKLQDDENSSSKTVLESIFRYLPIRDLKSARSVCTDWCKVASPLLFTKTVLTSTNRMYDLHGYKIRDRGLICFDSVISSTTTSSFPECHQFKHVEVDISHLGWTFDLQTTLATLFQSPQTVSLETLRIYGYRLAAVNKLILPHYLTGHLKQLKSLTLLSPIGFQNAEPIPLLKMVQLDQVCSLEKFVIQLRGQQSICWEFLSKCPNLKTFKLVTVKPRGRKTQSVPAAALVKHLNEVLPHLTRTRIEKLGFKIGERYDLDTVYKMGDFINAVAEGRSLNDVSYKLALKRLELLAFVKQVPVPSRSAKFHLLYNLKSQDKSFKNATARLFLKAVHQKGYTQLPQFKFCFRNCNMYKSEDILKISDNFNSWDADTSEHTYSKVLLPLLPEMFPLFNFVCHPSQSVEAEENRVFTSLFEAKSDHPKTLYELPMMLRKHLHDGISKDLSLHDISVVHRHAVRAPRSLTRRDVNKLSGLTCYFVEMQKEEIFQVHGIKCMEGLPEYDRPSLFTRVIVTNLDGSLVHQNEIQSELEPVLALETSMTEYLEPFRSDDRAVATILHFRNAGFQNLTQLVDSCSSLELHQRENWKENTVVLNAVFEKLENVSDLKALRLVSKSWCLAASPLLAKRTTLSARTAHRGRFRGLHAAALSETSGKSKWQNSIRYRQAEIRMLEIEWQGHMLKFTIRNTLTSPAFTNLLSLKISGFHTGFVQEQLFPCYIANNMNQLESLSLLNPYDLEVSEILPDIVLQVSSLELPTNDADKKTEVKKLTVHIRGNWRPHWDFLYYCPKLKCCKLFFLDEIETWGVQHTQPAVVTTSTHVRECLDDVLPFLESKGLLKLGLKFRPDIEVEFISNFVQRIFARMPLTDFSFEMFINPSPSQPTEIIRSLPAPTRYAKYDFRVPREAHGFELSRDTRLATRDLAIQLLQVLRETGHFKLARLELKLRSQSPPHQVMFPTVFFGLLVTNSALVLRIELNSERLLRIPLLIKDFLARQFRSFNYVCVPVMEDNGTTRLLEALFPPRELFELAGINDKRRDVLTKDMKTLHLLGLNDASVIRKYAVGLPQELRIKNLHCNGDWGISDLQTFVFSQVDPQKFQKVLSTTEVGVDRLDISNWGVPGNLVMVRTFHSKI